jgi:hypothetical protein
MLVFLVGALLGLVLGAAVCVRYLRQEMAADIGPSLARVQHRLDAIEVALNLAAMTRYAELSSRSPDIPPPTLLS